jgi:hypothetical protein
MSDKHADLNSDAGFESGEAPKMAEVVAPSDNSTEQKH